MFFKIFFEKGEMQVLLILFFAEKLKEENWS